MKHCLSALACCLLLSTAAPVAASEERATATLESRQGLLRMVRFYFGPILGMVRQQIPFDGDVVSHNATKIAELSAMIPDAFALDTTEYDLETEALDNIWSNMDDFNGKAATVVERANALAAAGAGGLEATQKAFGAMGGACKACHDEYRVQN